MTAIYKFIPSPLILLVLVMGGCTSSSGGSRSQRNPNEISQEEIQGARSASNAYSLTQRLRPNWLRKRGRSSITNPTEIAVYVDGARYAGPQALRQFQVVNIESMQYLSPSRATNKFGGGHEHGAILVYLKGR